MRKYDYTQRWTALLTPEIVKYLTTIHEYKGRQQLIASRHADVLESLREVAKIQSTESSNNLEGIFTTNERLKKIVLDKTVPQTRNEREIAGYRDVLNTIHENAQHIPVKSSVILQLHRDLYKYENSALGGVYKPTDNVIKEVASDGSETIRFVPVPAWETPESVERLCDAYERAIGEGEADPLLLISMFILDFLCIHPFLDGNGRMSRLLILLLCYQTGYSVGRYISIEKLIEKTKDSYYAALQESSAQWQEEDNDYAPFVRYMLGILTAAYREFFDRTNRLEEKNLSKSDCVKEEIRGHVGTITKAELLNILPDISESTVQHVLADLTKKRTIKKIGGGRYTEYTWNWEEDG